MTGDLDIDIEVEVDVDIDRYLGCSKGGSKVNSGNVSWYIGSYSTDFDNSEVGMRPFLALLIYMRVLVVFNSRIVGI